jgi:multiple sugar transport system permease protein
VATDAREADGNAVQRATVRMLEEPDLVYRILTAVVTGFFLLMALFPLYWLLVLALTPNDAISNVGVLPNGFNVAAFVQVFEKVPFHLYMLNSVVLASMTTVLVLVIGSLAGYIFGRLEFPGRRVLLLGILLISYFPPAAFLIPLFRLFTGNVSLFGLSSPELFNTPGAIVLPLSALLMPLVIYILATFYSQIPDGLEDAARIEGDTRIGALRRVIVPLSAPGVATAGVLTFIVVYNEFFFSFLMTNGQVQNWAPIVHGMLQYQGVRDVFFNLMAAASLIGVVPMALVVLFAQEKIVSGLTAGALKE